MNRRVLHVSTALSAFFVSTPLWAATPADVWQSWQDTAASSGQTMTTESIEETAEGLVVTGLKMVQDDGQTTAEVEMPSVSFVDEGDGTVRVTLPDEVPLRVTFPADPATGKSRTITATLSQPDLDMTASGEAGDIAYTLAAPEVTLTLDQIDGASAAESNMVAQAVLSDVAADYAVKSGTNVSGIYDLRAASLNVSFSGSDPEAPDQPSAFDVALSLADPAMSGEGLAVNPALMDNLSQAVAAGLVSRGSMSAGATTVVANDTKAGKTTHVELMSAASALNFDLGPQGLVYGGSGKDVTMLASGGDLPFPELAIAYREAAFNLQMPLVKADQPQNFALLTRLVDFTISEEVWAMFDPTGQLPRDPATLVIDTKGTTTLTADIADPAAMGALQGPPALLDSLEVTALQAKAAGAELTGQGSFTFDNTDMETFAGYPAPTGTLNLTLTGGNGLMDKLTAMGLLSEEDVMGFRMMLAMFTTAVPDKDELTSTLEFRDKGFYANGQRLQ